MSWYWKARTFLCVMLLVTMIPVSIASAKRMVVMGTYQIHPDLKQAIMNAKAELGIPDRDENGEITYTFSYDDPEHEHAIAVTVTLGEPVFNNGRYEMFIILEEGDEIAEGTVEAWIENGNKVYVEPNLDYPERHNGPHGGCRAGNGSGSSCGCRSSGGRDGMLELQIKTNSGSHVVVREGTIVDLDPSRAVMCAVAIMIIIVVIVAIFCILTGWCRANLLKYRQVIAGDQPCLV